MAVVCSKVLLIELPLIYTAPDTCVFGAVNVWSDLGVFEPDLDETDMSLMWVVGMLKLTLYTEAGILVFDMVG